MLKYALLIFSANLIAVHSYCPPGKKTNDPQGRCCVFPFIYAGKKYYSCTTYLASHPWCSFDEYHTWNWAYCVDECASSPCKNGASCRVTNDSEVGYSCQPCPEGWIGKNCDKVDECVRSPCKNGANCKITEDGYSCQPCPAGWKGKDCDEDIDECKSAPCKNGGICENDKGTFTCKCNAGFTGHLCEKDIDECKSPSPCKNNGTCVNEHGSYTCNCSAGFTGKLCEKVVSVGSPEEPSEEPTPEGITYKPVGCFRDGPRHARAMPELLKNFRGNIDWNHLDKLVEKCADEAMRRRKKYFGLQFYGECRSVKNSGHNYDRYGENPFGCYKNLVGKASNNMVYKFELPE